MQELIKIEKYKIGTQEVNSVNARELYKALGVKKDFSNWIKPKLKGGMLDENVDYLVFALKGENLSGGRPTKEYILTLDTAKHLAMMSKTSKGKEIRNYFIEIEKQFTVKTRTSQGVPLELMEKVIHNLNIIVESNKALVETNQLLAKKITAPKEPKPKSTYSKSDDRPWTRKEEAILMECKAKGKSNRFIADYLDRSYEAVRTKSCRLRSLYIADIVYQELKKD